MEGLGVAANVIAVIDLAAKIAGECYNYAQKVKTAKADIDRVQKEIENLKGTGESVKRLLEGPNGDRLKTSRQLQAAVGEAVNQLQELDEKMRPKKLQNQMRRFGLRALKWPFESTEIERVLQDLRNCAQHINSALQVDQTAEIIETGAGVRRTEQLVHKVDRQNVLSRLPVAEGACFGSRIEDHELTCLPDTRVELLQQIQDWAQDLNAERVFWLNGMAGTGKSTISRTVAQLLDNDKKLGASFFFKTGEADRNGLSKFFSTIAADMVNKVPAFSAAVKATLDNDAEFLRRAPGKQLKDLVIEPLIQSQNLGCDRPIVLIIDALDECEQEQGIDLIIDLFTDPNVMRVPQLKVFITSRPEIPNRRGFAKASSGSYHAMILHELPKPVIEHDISVFLDYRLCVIKKNWNCLVTSDDSRLPSDWPGQERMQQLVEMAVPLFIFAATICRFIADPKFGNPDNLLQDVLKHGKPKQKSELNTTYLPILNRLVAEMDADEISEVVDKFRLIVGSIIVLEMPLSTQTLSQLLEVPRTHIDDRLLMLHSVLSIPDSSDLPVRMLHLSFKDFLTDCKNKETTPFWIDAKAAHAGMASRALKVLNSNLKQNICNLSGWGTQRSSIELGTINACLPPAVQYACSYWVHHIRHAGDRLVDDGLVHEFLQVHFLHWLEGLSLLGKAYECIGHVKAMRSLVDRQNGKELSDLLDDAVSFVLHHASIIDATPLQLYSSLLVFAPLKSRVRSKYESVIPDWIMLRPEVEHDWGQYLQILEGHLSSVLSVSFSHDSKLVVSASEDLSIRIWDVETGQCVWILEGHIAGVSSAVFSHDSSRVLSASWDGTIRVWSVGTGECIRIIKGHTKPVTQAVYSRTSALIVSGSRDGTVKVWQAATGRRIRTFEGHTRVITSVAISHDSKLVAFASNDGIGRIWRLDSEDEVRLMRRDQDSRWIESVFFSHNSAFLACSLDLDRDNLWQPVNGRHAVGIFQTESGQCVRTLKHDSHVKSVALSHDSALLASDSDAQVFIWRLDTGKCVQVLTGHQSHVHCTAFSHDSTLIASSSDDGTVRIWRVDASKENRPSPNRFHKDEYTKIRLSPNSTTFAITNDIQETWLWDTMAGKCIKAFEDRFCAFSPDSSLLLLRSSLYHLQIVRADTGVHLRTLQGHTNKIVSAVFSHDSSLVVSTSEDNTVRVWLVNTGKCVQVFEAWSDLRSAVLSPNSQLLAVGTEYTVSLARTSDGHCLQTWKVDKPKSSRLAFSPNSALLACLSRFGSLQVWQCDTGKRIQAWEAELHRVSCTFSSDSKFIASNFLDFSPYSYEFSNRIQIWRIETGECLHTTSWSTSKYRHSVSFTSDDSGLATDHEAFALSNFPPDRLNSKPVSSSLCGYGISLDGVWLTWNRDNLLRLPAEYRPTDWAVSGSVVVLGYSFDRPIILRLATPLPDTVAKTHTQITQPM